MAVSIKDHKRRLAALKQDQATWITHWQELSNYWLPRHGDWLFRDTYNQNKGDKRNQHIIDSTVRYAVVTFQAGMMSGLTSPSRPWFRLTTPDPDLMELPTVKEWLYLAETRLREWLAKSNLYSVLPSLYGDLGVFATSGMGCFGPSKGSPAPNQPPVFTRYPIGSYYIGQNADQIVDTFYLEREMKVIQLVNKFGEKNCSDTVQKLYGGKQYDQRIKVVYSITSNANYNGQYLDNKNLPYSAVWFESSRSDTDNAFLSESGFHEFPVMAPRWEVDTDSSYGMTSPGIDALGDAKALQFQQKRKAQAIDKLVDPPLQAPEKLRNSPISMLPGDVTYYDENEGARGVRSLYDFNPQIGTIIEDISEIQNRIKQGFFTDLFLIISNTQAGPQQTAYEVAQLKEEKLLMLGPALENMNKGLLKPLIDRSFGMMLRANMLPPPPPELHGMDLKIEYISILAQAQRMVALGSIERFMSFAGTAAQLNPAALDKVNFDQTIDDYAESLGIAPNIIVSDDQVAATRAVRAKQEAAQRMVENAPGLAGAAKDLSQTDPSGDNGLTRLIRSTTGAAT